MFNLSKSKPATYEADDFNTIAGFVPKKYLTLTLGKIGVPDFFDYTKYSHNPKTQFLFWSMMDSGAWNYPANVRGYTPSFLIEYVSPRNEFRYAISMVPITANGNKMNRRIEKANSQTLEYAHTFEIFKQPGAIRLLTFLTTTDMGNYRESIKLNPIQPNIVGTRKYERTKFGFVVNAEQNISNNLGVFLRASWNDGRNETWTFTEIDRSICTGISFTGVR